MRWSPLGRACALAWGVGLAGCTTDASDLAYRPEVSVSEPSGRDPLITATGGEAGAPSVAAPSQGAAMMLEPETSGGRIELLHGLVDAEELLLCLVEAGEERRTAPQQAQRLGFAEIATVSEARDASTPDLTVDVFVHRRPLGTAPTCRELWAMSERRERDERAESQRGVGADAGLLPDAGVGARVFRAASLAISGAAFHPGESFLLTVTGCVEPESAPPQRCGPPRDELAQGTEVVVSPLPRGSRDDVTLQFLHASKAAPQLDVALLYDGAPTVRLANTVPFTGLRPRDSARLDAEALGSSLRSVEVSVAGANAPAFAQAWSESWRAQQPELGASFLLVFIGSDPEAARSPGFAGPQLVLVSGPQASEP